MTGVSVAVGSTVSALIEKMKDAQDPAVFNAALSDLGALIARDPAALSIVLARKQDLLLQLDNAKIGLAAVMAKMAACSLPLSDPETVYDSNARLAHGGPGAEVALAALHILRYAGDVVPLNPEDIEAALEAPASDPNFGWYPSVFAAAVAHLHTAAYFLLDANDCHTALASAPPEQETFPPLPFPRIWIEMNHLVPYMRFVRDSTDADRQLDVLGIGVAEIQQGRVWDIYAPFNFNDHPEFFFLAARITPGGIVQADETLGVASVAFDILRDLAVGGAHLVTARNVETTEVSLPRHQRKRLGNAFAARLPKLYYVDLARAGERATAASGAGSREYHVRWLVRGHWRHIDSGRSFCTCCEPPQIATWVDPYIKGPPGAPWKGKQIRRHHERRDP